MFQPTIPAPCDTCGPVRVAIADIEIRGIDNPLACYSCPRCSAYFEFLIPDTLADHLIVAGASFTGHPEKAVQNPGGPITADEILSFIQALDRDDLLVARLLPFA